MSTRRGGGGDGALGRAAATVTRGGDGGGVHDWSRALLGTGVTMSRKGNVVSSKTTWRDVMKRPEATS